jgi:inosine-uridine nucleoside N-ribohydrolase
MPRKVVIVADPGIDTAFALAIALLDPGLDVLAIAATAGNVSAEQATRNVQTVVAHVDPQRLPRIGTALPVSYDTDGSRMHGPGGLGGMSFPAAQLHQAHPSDKVLADQVRLSPGEVDVVVLGPMTVVARAIDLDPELPRLVRRLVCMGGAWREPGNAGPVSEFHFYCDPLAARQVLHSGAHVTLIPLDVSRKLLYSPSDLLNLPAPESSPCKFLRQIVPFGIGATSNMYGIEGFQLKDVLAVAAVALPGLLSTRSLIVDVETRGDLTRGMSVVDLRANTDSNANVDLAEGVDVQGVRDYVRRVLAGGAA